MNDNDRELERLMNDQLDGVATPEDSERLGQTLASREEARAEYRKLGGVFSALSRLEMEEPPATLKQGVLRAIRALEAPSPARESWLRSIPALFRRGSGFRHVYSFAAGAALGVLAFAILTGNLMTRPGVDSRPFTGTMAPLSADGIYEHIVSRDFTLRDGHVLAEVLSGKEGLVARITADAPVGSTVVVSFDPGDWRVSTLRQAVAGNEVMLGTGRLSIRMQRLGQSQYLLYLARKGPAGSPLRIAINSPDGSAQGELDTGALRSGS
jgi:anti-sigma factor RsiW